MPDFYKLSDEEGKWLELLGKRGKRMFGRVMPDEIRDGLGNKGLVKVGKTGIVSLTNEGIAELVRRSLGK